MKADDSSASVRAYRYIHDAIIEGAVASGEMLAETGLAEQLGMSRTPVRAALLRLQEEQWVTIYPKRGALVTGLSDRDIAEIADARFIFETTAVQRASAETLNALIPRLEDSLARQEQAAEALEAGDLRQFIDVTTEFHRMFVESGGNTVLLELSERLSARRRYTLFRLGEELVERREAMLAEHRALVDALRAGDVGLFADILRAHLRDTHHTQVGPSPVT